MNDTLQIATFVVIVLLVAAWYLSYSAARLDRLHAKVEGAMSALDAQLIRRAEAALELANSGVLDPASALLIADAATAGTGTTRVKRGMAEMLKGGVIMDVVTPEQAKIAEDAGACRRHGARAGARRHPRPGRRLADERPRHDRRASSKAVSSR
jgi:hypothetical protein